MLMSKNNSEHSHVCFFKELVGARSSSVSDASRAAVLSISAITGSVKPFLYIVTVLGVLGDNWS